MNSTLSEPASTRPRRRRRLQDAQRLGLGNAFVRPARGIGLGMLAALAIVLGMWLYHANAGFSPPGETARDAMSPKQMQTELAALSAQNATAYEALAAAEARLQQQQDSQGVLLEQLARVETDNRQLQQNLAAFEEVLPRMGAAFTVGVGGFQLERADAGQLRYRLLVIQAGQQSSEQVFKGELELVAIDAQGNNAMMILPVDSQEVVPPARHLLEFSHYQRIDGLVQVPEGVVIKSLQARVWQKGRVRAVQSVNL